MANSNETGSLPRPLPGHHGAGVMLWDVPPLCQCGGAGIMPIIGWPGRGIICSCEAGKLVAQKGPR